MKQLKNDYYLTNIYKKLLLIKNDFQLTKPTKLKPTNTNNIKILTKISNTS